MTEDQLEQETLGWLSELGYSVHSGYDIAHDGPNPQRASYRQVLLPFLRYQGIRQLDYVLISHDDSDHSGDWPTLRARYPTAQLVSDFPDALLSEVSFPPARPGHSMIGSGMCVLNAPWGLAEHARN